MPPPNSPRPVSSSRPTIIINGSVATALDSDLIRLRVTQRLCRPAELTLTVALPLNRRQQPDPAGHLRSGLLDLGNKVEMHAGKDMPVFEGRIVAMAHTFDERQPPSIEVLAMDPLDAWQHVRRFRRFEDLTLGDCFQTLASSYEQTVELAGLPNHVFATITQFHETDFDLVDRLAREANVNFWWESGQLQVRPRSKPVAPALKLTYGRGLIRFTTTRSLASQVSNVRVGGWDMRGKRPIDVSVGHPRPPRGCQSGPAILDTALGPRALSLVSSQSSADYARRMATSIRDDRHEAFITAHGTADGAGQLRVGRTVSVRGMGIPVDGAHYLTAVQPSYDATQGLVTHFTAERSCYRPPTP